jgi:hypothetical protein
MSTIKITLDASALQLLMDKDPEFQVAVNQAALAWLRKSIIKPVTDAKIQEALHACKEELGDYFDKQFKESYRSERWPSRVSKEFEEKVHALGNEMIDSVIRENLKEKINVETLEAEFKLKLDKLLEDFQGNLERYFASGHVDRIVRDVANNKVSALLERVEG